MLELLKNHDWTYAYSDDHRIWKRGERQRKAIQAKLPKHVTYLDLHRHIVHREPATEKVAAYLQELGWPTSSAPPETFL